MKLPIEFFVPANNLFMRFIVWMSGILLLGSGLFILPIGYFLKADPETVLKISQSFNHIALGAVAVIGTMAAGVAIDQKTKEEKNIEKLKQKYPRSLFDNMLSVIEKESERGKLYLRDMRKSPHLIRHIGNRSTYKDLEFDDMQTKTMSDSEFDGYPKGDRILTRGVPGT